MQTVALKYWHGYSSYDSIIIEIKVNYIWLW